MQKLRVAPASRPRDCSWEGMVLGLHTAPRAFLPLRSVERLTAIAARGIERDRYCSTVG